MAVDNQYFSTLIKPASSQCNVGCQYCFYHSLAKSRQVTSYGTMSKETVEKLIKKALSFATRGCSFAFQGGEPTLAGLEYFKFFVKTVNELNHDGRIQVQYFLQTNGILLDREWAEFLRQNDFLVGISLDGPADIHDFYRKDQRGNGTYVKVMKAIDVLKENNVQFNVLTVINNKNVKHPRKLFKFYKNKKFLYVQLISCLEPLTGDPWEYSPSAKEYGRFLITMFNLWKESLESRLPISIRTFDNWVQMAAGYPPESCELRGHCSNQFVIEADGSVYPCDFYVTDQWCLGNINDLDIVKLGETGIAQKFVAISHKNAKECHGCQWFSLCKGGCRRQKEPYNPSSPSVDRLCQGYKMFFEQCYDSIYETAEKVLSPNDRHK